jgi:hypothetical protein
MAKRAREQELKERRERKREKKAERAANKHLEVVEVSEDEAVSELTAEPETTTPE